VLLPEEVGVGAAEAEEAVAVAAGEEDIPGPSKYISLRNCPSHQPSGRKREFLPYKSHPVRKAEEAAGGVVEVEAVVEDIQAL
jgi:hypothetical protein